MLCMGRSHDQTWSPGLGPPGVRNSHSIPLSSQANLPFPDATDGPPPGPQVWIKIQEWKTPLGLAQGCCLSLASTLPHPYEGTILPQPACLSILNISFLFLGGTLHGVAA